MPERLVLFDGVCGFCNVAVQWLLRLDRQNAFVYAPLQGPTAATIREQHPEVPDSIDTIVFVDAGVVYLRSRAVVRLVRYLPAPWSWARIGGIFPAWLTDIAYNAFAAIRYRVFGKLEACRVPRPEERARFLP